VEYGAACNRAKVDRNREDRFSHPGKAVLLASLGVVDDARLAARLSN
jgi:hypothetical protein